jgi:hypothetical protein
LKDGIFFGPQFKQLFKDQDFSTNLKSTEKKEPERHLKVYRNFLGNEKVEN